MGRPKARCLLDAAHSRGALHKKMPLGDSLREGDSQEAAMTERRVGHACRRTRPTGTPSLDADGRPASKLVRNERDPEAAWAKKGGTYFFGYKAHVAMDEGSRIIRRVLLTPASVNDTVVADQLICGDEQIVYADKAYGTHARSRLLKELGLRTASCAGAPLASDICVDRAAQCPSAQQAGADRTPVRAAQACSRLRPSPLSGLPAQRRCTSPHGHRHEPEKVPGTLSHAGLTAKEPVKRPPG